MVVGKAFFTIDSQFYNPAKCECVGYLIQPALPAKNYYYTTAHTTKLTFFCYSHFRFRFPFQYWMLSKTGEIRRDEACLDYAGSDVILYPCHGSKGNQFWTYDHQVIIYLIV